MNEILNPKWEKWGNEEIGNMLIDISKIKVIEKMACQHTSKECNYDPCKGRLLLHHSVSSRYFSASSRLRNKRVLYPRFDITVSIKSCE